MTTYSYLQYGIKEDIIAFQPTIALGLDDFIKTYSEDEASVKSLILNSKTEGIVSVPSSSQVTLKNFLNNVNGLTVQESQTILLKVEIIDNITVGNIEITSINLDRSKSYFKKDGESIQFLLNVLKPIEKFKTMGNCKSCLKLTWQNDPSSVYYNNSLGFSGNLGATWNGGYKNFQKKYIVDIPNYTNLSNYGQITQYEIYWQPNITTTVNTFDGGTYQITNESKWIANPINQTQLNNNTFFSIISDVYPQQAPYSGSCPYANTQPNTPPWYNFFGNKGYFLLEGLTQEWLGTGVYKPCPTFKEIPNPTSFGWICTSAGCIPGSPGATGSFSTYQSCSISCPIDYGWNCFSGSCTPGTKGNPGQYLTYSECQIKCIGNYGWICSGSICIPGTVNNTGSYTTEAECIGRCASYYRCTSTGCVPVPNGTPGAYSSLAACQSSCSVGYNCISGVCITASFGTTGSYATLTACQLSCSANYGFNCTANGCVPGSAGNPGTYINLQDCQSKCTASYGYTCTPNGCITGSLASPGIYNTLQECQITCTSSYGFTCTPNGCVTGSVSSPGIYSSVAACIAACTGSYGWNCTSTGCVPGNPAQTGSYSTQQACEAACPTGWNCTGPSIQSASFSGSIVNGFTASGLFTGIPLTESIDSLNIFTNGTSILNPGTFSYNFYPNVPVSFTASFTGKSDSASNTGSIDFYFYGLPSTPTISVKNFPTNTSSSVTRIISGTISPTNGSSFTANAYTGDFTKPTVRISNFQLEFNSPNPSLSPYSCYPVFFPNTGSYLTAIACQSSCSIDYGWNCTKNGCVPGILGNPGQYATLLECQTKCNINYGWSCISGSCITGSITSPGTYLNQIDCILNCSQTASYGWNCFSGSCIPGTINNTGSYATLPLCQTSCSRQYGWICTSNGCVTGSAGNTGSFSTLSACESYCFYGYNCVSGSCVTSSFGTTGSFSNINDCRITCSITPYWDCNKEVGCFQVPLGQTGPFTSFESCSLSAKCYPPTSSFTGYNCSSGYCVTASFGTTGSYATLAECELRCTSSYGYNCVSYLCVPGTINNTGSYATLAECELGCSLTTPEFSPCDCVTNPLLTNLALNPNFTNGNSYWNTSGPINNPEHGITQLFFGDYSAGIQLFPTTEGLSNNYESSSVYLSQSNIFTIGCSYKICFNAYMLLSQTADNWITIANGVNPQTLNIIGNTVPTQPYTFELNNIQTTDLLLYFFNNEEYGTLIYLDNFCVTKISCPPDPDIPNDLDCLITGSAYSYSTGSYDCLCPVGYISNGSGSCVTSGSNITIIPSILSGSLVTNSPATNFRWGTRPPSLYWNTTTPSFNSSGVALVKPTGSTVSSPLQNNPNIYQTQFYFDLLKADFWYKLPGENSIIPSPINQTPLLPPFRLMNQLMVNLPIVNTWLGGGVVINNTVGKWYHIVLAADDAFRLKINYNYIVNTLQQNVVNPTFNNQQHEARLANYNSFIPNNLTFNNDISFDYTSQAFQIYPIYLNPGCNTIRLEGINPSPFSSGFAGLILDNSAEEIANATAIGDLNIIWNAKDDLIFKLGMYPLSVCPANTTPIDPNQICLGCSSSIATTIPCGDCIECYQGKLYNGYVVDKGGYQLQGRGPGGIVNTGSVLNTWVIPTELDWNLLSTSLDNNFLSPSNNYEGALNTNSGGKLKDYSRDNNASCWGFPNAGAQTSTNVSGWAGVAGGKRDNNSVFSDLGFNGEWWSANSLSTSPITNATLLATRELKHYSTDVYRNIRSKNYGLSLRLVRPALTTETNGQLLLNAYQGKDGTYYNGIVIGSKVWITKNLTETLYNNGTTVQFTTSIPSWNNSINTADPYVCFYEDNSSNNVRIVGNINPLTNECYPYTSYYVYQNCSTGTYLIQTQIGNTTTPEKVQKDSNENCWKFIEVSTGIPDYPSSTIFGSFTTNYFASSPTVYNNCEECNAIHTLYLSFNTKPC